KAIRQQPEDKRDKKVSPDPHLVRLCRVLTGTNCSLCLGGGHLGGTGLGNGAWVARKANRSGLGSNRKASVQSHTSAKNNVVSPLSRGSAARDTLRYGKPGLLLEHQALKLQEDLGFSSVSEEGERKRYQKLSGDPQQD
ncbi:hypothetical protein Bbelb_339650, partial [Branchiostoma belcheri]